MGAEHAAWYFSPHAYNFIRIAACVALVRLGDPAENAPRTLELMRQDDAERMAPMVSPN